MEQKEQQYDIKKAIFYMVVSSLSFAFMQIFVKLTAGQFHVMVQVFFRNFIMAIITGLIIIKNKEKFFGTGQNKKLMILRSVFGYIGVITAFYSINKIAVADAVIIQRLSPIFVILIACFVFKEKLTKEKMITVVFLFIGAILVIRPKFDSRLFPSLVAMSSALFASFAYMCLSRIGRKENTESIIFTFSIFSSVMSLPFMILYFKIPSLEMFIYLVLVGIFSALGQFGLTISYQYAPASDVSIFNYTGLLFVVILGYLILGEKISIYSILGIIVIFTVSLVSYLIKINEKKIKNQEK